MSVKNSNKSEDKSISNKTKNVENKTARNAKLQTQTEHDTSSDIEPKGLRWIKVNKKYLSICRYAIFVIFASIVIYMVISHWGNTTAFLRNMLQILEPFLLGVLIAYFLAPLVKRVDHFLQKKVAKGKYEKVTLVVSIAVSYVVVLGFITIAFVFVIPQVAQSVQELTNKIPSMYRQFTKELMNFEKKYPEIDMQVANDQIANMVPNLVEYGTNLVSSLLPMVYSVSVSIVKLIINIILGIIISIYMIYSKDVFRYQAKRVVYAIFPEDKGNALCTTFRECNDIFGAFLISKAIDSLIIGCICCIAMNIIGLPYAVLLSVIVGITNMIPYFGPFIGAVPGVLIYLCINWELALVFAIMILIIQQFDGLILGPRLLGQSTGLSPIWVIFAITVGGAYFGVIGMFIGVPVVAVIAFLINKIITSRLQGRKIKALEEFDD